MENTIGKSVEFTASRILKGNPVKGKVITDSDEWIEVELTKSIHGMANSWEAGERKKFRKSLINGQIKYS